MLKKQLAVFLLLFIPNSAFAGAADRKQYQQASSVQLLQDFLTEYDDSEYGGAYIGSNGQLVLNLVENNAGQLAYISQKNNMVKTDANKPIEVRYVKYTMEYLKNVVDKITPHLSELGLLGVGIDEEKNCIVLDAGPDYNFSAVQQKICRNTELLINHNMNSNRADLFVVNQTDLTIENTAAENSVQKEQRVSVLLQQHGCSRGSAHAVY